MTRYRYRGSTIPTPWTEQHRLMTGGQDTWSARCVETRTAGAAGGPGKPPGAIPAGRPGPTQPVPSTRRRCIPSWRASTPTCCAGCARRQTVRGRRNTTSAVNFRIAGSRTVKQRGGVRRAKRAHSVSGRNSLTQRKVLSRKMSVPSNRRHPSVERGASRAGNGEAAASPAQAAPVLACQVHGKSSDCWRRIGFGFGLFPTTNALPQSDTADCHDETPRYTSNRRSVARCRADGRRPGRNRCGSRTDRASSVIFLIASPIRASSRTWLPVRAPARRRCEDAALLHGGVTCASNERP